LFSFETSSVFGHQLTCQNNSGTLAGSVSAAFKARQLDVAKWEVNLKIFVVLWLKNLHLHIFINSAILYFLAPNIMTEGGGLLIPKRN